MILGTTFCTYESAFTPEECDKIIELGLKSNKQKVLLGVIKKKQMIKKYHRLIKQYMNYKMNMEKV